MSAVLHDERTLKLTVDHHGELWYAAGASWPRWSRNRAELALASGLLAGAERVRVPGLVCNAALLIALYEHKRAGRLRSLEVCSPLCCPSAVDRRDPELLLCGASDFRLPPSLGGWHEFGPLDLPSYRLACLSDPLARQSTLAKHPGWPALSFIAGLDKDSVAILLGLVLDPRWFVDPSRPGRSNRLERFLGLSPCNQLAVSAGGTSGDARPDRCALVYDCWRQSKEAVYDELPAARRFLVRRGSRQSACRGDLAASKYFLSYLRWTWLDALCTGSQKGQLFVPEHFFDRLDEAEAFRAHQKNVRRD